MDHSAFPLGHKDLAESQLVGQKTMMQNLQLSLVDPQRAEEVGISSCLQLLGWLLPGAGAHGPRPPAQRQQSVWQAGRQHFQVWESASSWKLLPSLSDRP